MSESNVELRGVIVKHALWIVMAGLLGGFAWAWALIGEVSLSPIPIVFADSFPGEPDRWRAVHVGCLLNAVLALVLAANLDLFRLEAGAAKAVRIGVPLTLWGNAVFYAFAVFAPNHGLSLGDNLQGEGNLAGAIAYSAALAAAFALIYVVIVLLRAGMRGQPAVA